MSKPTIDVENISKLYRLGVIGATTLRDSLERRWNSLLGRGNQKTKLGASELVIARDHPQVGTEPNTFWALKDVSFSVEQGEVVGIIGKNGAGKSTLLKILSRITEPTTGQAILRGRTASILEVGTGFHGELSGRENIYLNGAMLGMRKFEVERKFDEIVDFSGVEEFIDTPVKRYSSGMYVRLAFAVAAHLDPEILIIDEVLAVGDSEFQRKCLQKIEDAKKDGRTVFLVSHNMVSIRRLCARTILLEKGKIAQDGATLEVTEKYTGQDGTNKGEQIWDDIGKAPGNKKVRLCAARIISGGIVSTDVDINKEITIEVEFFNLYPGLRVRTDLYILDKMESIILGTSNTPSDNSLPEEWYGRPHPVGKFRARCTIPKNFLNLGSYYISLHLVTDNPTVLEAQAEKVLSFSVNDTGVMLSRWSGSVHVRLPWQVECLSMTI